MTAPLRKIDRRLLDDRKRTITEYLECGHENVVPDTGQYVLVNERECSSCPEQQ